MFFNSISFFIFFACVYACYRLIPFRAQNTLLLIASYFFYGCWDWRFLSLILISTLTDYITGAKICEATSPKSKKAWLIFSIVVNLSILGFFKYYNFFIDSLVPILDLFGLHANYPVLQIILPVGISFYTFQTMTYSIDIYRGTLKPTRNFFDFALFVAFFPQLVAGPIERASHLLPQITSPRSLSTAQNKEGAWLIIWGLFKKVVIADNLALLVDPLFQAHSTLTGPEVMLASYAFAFQIYCDFSAYSDIARGTSKLLGFDLMVNFRLPFFANSPSDFWHRWHISLSTWLRDYLYIPLGGNRGNQLFLYRNLMLTMILGGLWHGAAWTFVVWGLYQGALLVLQRIISPYFKAFVLFQNRFVQIFVTFQLMSLGWLIFRAQTMDQLISMIKALSSGWAFLGGTLHNHWLLLLYMIPLILIQGWQISSKRLQVFNDLPFPLQASAAAILCYSLFVYGAIKAQQFIYFQF